MKKIGIIIGTEIESVNQKYYLKHKKHFDDVIEELELDSIEDISYDIQIYTLIKKFAPKNNYTKTLDSKKLYGTTDIESISVDEVYNLI